MVKKQIFSQWLAKNLYQFWNSKTLSHYLLFPTCILFYTISIMRKFLLGLTSKKCPIPVIIIGNISVGGNGKTPFVIELCNYLKYRGYKVGVISKGYGRKERHESLVITKEPQIEKVGDEVLLIWKKTLIPIAVSHSRYLAATLLAKQGCQIAVCDDGLQDYSIYHDLEISIEADQSYGNGFLLPLGPLRELPSRLNQVDFEVNHTYTDGNQNYTMKYVIDELENPYHGVSIKLCKWAKEKVIHAISAIGSPKRFYNLLEQSGFILANTTSLLDHEHIPRSYFEETKESTIFITEKDATKLKNYSNPKIWVVKVKMVLNKPINKLIEEKIAPLVKPVC